MIEKLVADYLNSELLVPCVLEVPEDPKPEQYIVLEKTGSSVHNHLHTDSIAVQSCACSLYEAALLNESVKATMSDLIADHRILRIRNRNSIAIRRYSELPIWRCKRNNERCFQCQHR